VSDGLTPASQAFDKAAGGGMSETSGGGASKAKSVVGTFFLSAFIVTLLGIAGYFALKCDLLTSRGRARCKVVRGCCVCGMPY
jgi:hypothetical protein